MPIMLQKQPKKPLGIYIHVPFCRSKCQYCDFYSLGGSRDRGLMEGDRKSTRLNSSHTT